MNNNSDSKFHREQQKSPGSSYNVQEIKNRLIVSLVLIPIVLISVLYSSFLFYILIFLVCYMASKEYSDMLLNYDIQKQRILEISVSFLLVLIPIFSFLYRPIIYVGGILWIFAVQLIVNKNVFEQIIRTDIRKTVFGIVYIVTFFSSISYMRNVDEIMLLHIILIVWISDISAYFFGKKFGKHLIYENISKGKTIEGGISALICTSVYSAVCIGFSIRNILFGAILCIFSIIGDMFESALKRYAGRKDSGNILGEHGGILDRIDGLIATSIVASILYMILYK